METDPQSASIFTQLLILLVLTLIRGYFAGAEMAVASVNKNKIHRLKEQGNTKAALIEHLMEGSTAFLSAIQLIKRDTSLWIFPCLMQKEPDLRRLFLL